MHYQDQIKCLMNPCRYCFEGIASLVESLDYMDLCEQLADPILSTRHLGKPTSAQYELQILPGLLDIRSPGSIHERVCKVANVNFICHFLWLASQREWTQICRANPKTYCRWVIQMEIFIPVQLALHNSSKFKDLIVKFLKISRSKTFPSTFFVTAYLEA